MKNQLKHPKYSGKPPKELIDAISGLENTSRENLQTVVRHIGHVRRSVNNTTFEQQLSMLQKIVEQLIPVKCLLCRGIFAFVSLFRKLTRAKRMSIES